MSGSVEELVSVTVPCSVVPGSTAEPAGAVVSIVTVAVFSCSTLPARSVERKAIVCSPSLE